MVSGKEKPVFTGRKEVSLWLEYAWFLTRGGKANTYTDLRVPSYFNIRRETSTFEL